MTATLTPRRDAVEAWLAGDWSAPLVWPEERWPDPPEWADYGRRIEAAVNLAASGAGAELGVDPLHRYVVDTRNGRRIPAPPRHRKAPKPRGVKRPPRRKP